MKHLLNLFIILIVSISLSFFGWFVDSDHKTNSILLTVFEIFMLSLFFFIFITPFYFIVNFLKSK